MRVDRREGNDEIMVTKKREDRLSMKVGEVIGGRYMSKRIGEHHMH